MNDTNTAEREALQVIDDCLTALFEQRGHASGRVPAALRAVDRLRASLAASAGSEPVATIKSWTNGSYWRNYNVVFHRDDLPIGTDLYTHPSPPEGMAGWKLVPIEPTVAQREAMRKGTGMSFSETKIAYAAMIAAAPPLPASEAKEL